MIYYENKFKYLKTIAVSVVKLILSQTMWANNRNIIKIMLDSVVKVILSQTKWLKLNFIVA